MTQCKERANGPLMLVNNGKGRRNTSLRLTILNSHSLKGSPPPPPRHTYTNIHTHAHTHTHKPISHLLLCASLWLLLPGFSSQFLPYFSLLRSPPVRHTYLGKWLHGVYLREPLTFHWYPTLRVLHCGHGVDNKPVTWTQPT